MCKKTKKINSFFLIASIFLSLSIVPVFASSNPSSWAVEEVSKAKNEGLVTDSVMVDYQANITREQFCEMVVRAYEKISGEKATVGNMYFSDTSNVEILKAANLGIVTGYGNNVFGPNDLITREQIAAMLVRMIDKSVSYANINIYNNNKFNDGDDISQWAIPSVNFAYDKGIMQGVGNNCIDPQANTTCEQAILLVYRLYKSNSENNEYVFNDSAFEYSVRRAIAYKLHYEWGSTYDKQLTADLLNSITSLILYDIPDGKKLTDISDIDKLKNLQLIEFENDINNITNLELISDSEIKFDDFAFELCVRMSLPRGDRNDDGSIYIGRITDEMLKRITELSTSHLPNTVKLESLEDLVLTPNLVDLRLDPDHIEITDFSNIVNMQHLECLMLSGVEIENDNFLYDLDISGLINFPNSTNLFFDLGDNIDYREALNVYETVKKKMKQLGTQIDVAKTDYEKYKIIHDYLIKNMEYDYDFVWQAIDNGFDDLYLSLYIGKGICSVYANTYQYLCEYFGLDCWTVYGDAKGIIYEGDTPSWGNMRGI